MLAVSKKFKFVLLLLMLPVYVIGGSNAIISDETIVPPNYHTFHPDLTVGSEYVDPVFGTKVTRLTNSSRFNDKVVGGYFANAEICYFNCDGSYFLALENEWEGSNYPLTTFLYSGVTGTRIKMLGRDNIRPYWIRWALADRYTKNGEYVTFDPVYHFYKYEGNEIRLYDVRDMEYVVLHKFTEYNMIGPAGGEGDISDDGRYWVLDGDGQEMFVYDLIDDIKYPASTFNAGSIGSKGSSVGVDYAAISPKGNYIIVAWGTDPGIGRYRGIEVYDKNWNFKRQIFPGIIHWETGVDAYDEEVVYCAGTTRYPEFEALDGITTGDFVSIRLRDGYVRLLKRIPSWSHYSMSACNSVSNGDYLYVSVTATRSDDPYTEWYPFWGEIIEVPTDGSGKVRRLLHHRSRLVDGRNSKFATPDANVSRQGDRIVFRSTYNTEYGDLFMFDIPPREGSTVSDDTPPNPPINLSSSSLTSSSIELQWDIPEKASDGDLPVYYQVYRDNQKIGEVYSNRYEDTDVQEGQAYFYEIYSVDDANLVSETAASGTFATSKDNIFPQITDVRVRTQSSVQLQFSEPLKSSTAQTSENYQMNNGTVYSATLTSDYKTVVLETDELDLGLSYYVIAQNIRDASSQNNVAKQVLSPRFQLLADYFDDFESSTIDQYQLVTASRWQIASDGDDSALQLNTTNYDSPGGKMLGEYALVSSDLFYDQNFHIRCEARSTEDLLSNDHADYSIIFAYQDAQNYCYVQFHTYDVTFQCIENGQRVVFEEYATTIDLDNYQQIDLAYAEGQLRLAVNQKLITEWSVNIDSPGQIGFGSYNDAVNFDNINFEANSMFDLTSPDPPSGLSTAE